MFFFFNFAAFLGVTGDRRSKLGGKGRTPMGWFGGSFGVYCTKGRIDYTHCAGFHSFHRRRLRYILYSAS